MTNMADSLETGLLDLIFLNTDITLIGDAAGLQNSATAGSLYISLHTADPGEAGSQTTNEATYTNYARVAVARSGAGWSRSGSVMSNVAAITFATPGSSQSITHVGIGTDSSGAGKLLLSKALDSGTFSASASATPNFTAGQLTITFA
jgi:hypothetical protein